MDGGTNSVVVSIISGLSGIVIAYIANIASKKITASRNKMSGKDRMEQMFDGYERLIKQKDVEDDRKVKAINELESELAFTRKTVNRLEKALRETQHELEVSRQENQELRDLLSQMREEYKSKVNQ